MLKKFALCQPAQSNLVDVNKNQNYNLPNIGMLRQGLGAQQGRCPLNQQRNSTLPSCPAPSNPLAPHRQQHHTHRHRLLHQLQADNTPSAGDGFSNKADFSALWALRFRQFFNGRREYLESASKKKDADAPPAFIVDMDKRYAEQESDLQVLKTKFVKANKETMYGPGAPQLQQPTTLESSLSAQSVELGLTSSEIYDDIKQARMDLRTNPSAQATTAILRTRTFIIDLILFPIRMMQAIGSAWQAAFKTQRYENFLMAEGERIWYWRNRMENERWFWEMYFFERLLGPLLGSLAFQLVVPNNIVWAVVVPLCFHFWQNGQWPGPTNPELWVISYVGFYIKSWPGISALFTSLFLVW